MDIDTRARRAGLPDASVGVTELYQAHAVGLIKLGVSEGETAEAMGISRGTVKSSTSRALAALGRMLKEES